MENEKFRIYDCALIPISTGLKAQNLRELRDYLKIVPQGCLYYHFWGGLLNPRFDDPEFQNDFAVWAWHNLHDSKISEQLAVIDPTNFSDMEELRREVVEIIEERLAESDHVPWVRTGQEFHFLRSQIVIFETRHEYANPADLLGEIPGMSLGSVFFHFIDSRRRNHTGRNDFSIWLESFGDKYNILLKNLDNIDPFMTSLNELRQDIFLVFKNHFEEGK